MRLFQPKPNYASGQTVAEGSRVDCPLPVTFIRFRYPHHAAPSGYDRICDYINAPTLRLTNAVYIMGETILRPLCVYHSRWGGKFEYSRYDCVQEIQLLMRALLQERGRLYHFVYGEKSFHLTEKYLRPLKQRGHRLVATVHHMPEQQADLFQSHEHFCCFDAIFTMDKRSIPYWEGITNRKNVHWIQHGVDTDYFRPLGSRPSEKRVVFAGSHERDLATLCRTIELLAGDHKLKFDLICSSPILKPLAQRFSNVRIHHRVDDAEYLRLLQDASVLLLPLNSSTFCNVVLESLACGAPVVTTEGGIEVYLDPGSSRLSAKGDAESLAQHVHEVLNHFEVMSPAARTHAEAFSWREVAQRHVDLYQQIGEG